MKKLKAILGYTAAGLTVAAMVLLPFVLMDGFTRGVAAMGLRIDPAYTGGEVARTIERDGYQIVVRRPTARRSPLDRIEPFVQMEFRPAKALPARVREEIAVEGGGTFMVEFAVPREPTAALRMDVTPGSDRVDAARGAGRESFSRLITRVADAVIVRIPLREK